MAEEKFGAIIVGAGPAGSTAAYVLARAGVEVLLVEKGSRPGCKNMFGGRMYSHALQRVLPNFWQEAPLERRVTKERVTFMTGEQSVTMSCRNAVWGQEPYHSYTLLRGEFDEWLAGKAEEVGAMVAYGILVDEPIVEKGRVIGIRAGEDEMLADVVIAADGVNALMAQKAGLARMFRPEQVATGIKQVIKLSEEKIRDRFGLEGEEGVAQLFVGECSKGLKGGGFLYTNRDTLSLGLVIKASELKKSKRNSHELLEEFKESAEIRPLIAGGEVLEYSAHLVPEAGVEMLPQLYGDGMLVVGDAAGLVLNLGYMVRGMDLAIASGEAAAKAVLEAREKEDFTKESLKRYEELLKEDFVLKDLAHYQKSVGFLENERIFEKYPRLVTGLVSEMFTVEGKEVQAIWRKALEQTKKSQVSLWELCCDGWRGVSQL